MTLEVEQFVRKSFPVEGVRVTEENMADVAEWCNGDIRVNEGGQKYIKVRVQNPLTDRQTMGFVGDWVLYAGKGYKVYVDKAFRKSFDLPENKRVEANVFADDIMISAPGATSHSGSGNPGGTTHG